MFLFDTFEPGKPIGTRTLTLGRELVERWLMLYPEDRDGERMPPGMTAVVYSRAYSDILLHDFEGARLQSRLTELARRHNIGVVGPNSVGVINAETALNC